MRNVSLFVLLFLLAAPSLSRAEAVRRLSVEEAEKLALETNPTVVSASAHSRAVEYLARSALSRMLPVISLSDEYQHWNSEFQLSFPLGPMPATFTARAQD